MLASVAVLARILTPGDFGIVAMAAAVTSLFAMFKDAGLAIVTVQKATVSHVQVSNLFWINVSLGVLVAIVSAALSPIAAWFYHDTRLSGIVIALSLTFVLAGFTVQHEALLIRQMRFQVRAVINLAAFTSGFGVAWLLALNGFGYWSLVWMQLSTAAALLLLTWLASQWRPGPPRRDGGTRSLLQFGADLTAAATISRFANSADTFLLGRMFGADTVGIYSRAVALLIRPLEQVLMPAGSVLLPSLSRVQAAPERYRRIFHYALDAIAFVCFPATALLSALAGPLVMIVLGERWSATIPIFAAFSFAGIYVPLAYLACWLMESQGRGRDVVKAHMWLAVSTVVAICIGLPYGAQGVAWALSVCGVFVKVPLLYYFACRQGPVSIDLLWHRILHHLPCWVAVFAAATLARELLGDASEVKQLLVSIPIGLGAGGAAVLAVRPSRERALSVAKMLYSPFAGVPA
jgi:PST family polysaccharide transporter